MLPQISKREKMNQPKENPEAKTNQKANHENQNKMKIQNISIEEMEAARKNTRTKRADFLKAQKKSDKRAGRIAELVANLRDMATGKSFLQIAK